MLEWSSAGLWVSTGERSDGGVIWPFWTWWLVDICSSCGLFELRLKLFATLVPAKLENGWTLLTPLVTMHEGLTVGIVGSASHISMCSSAERLYGLPAMPGMSDGYCKRCISDAEMVPDMLGEMKGAPRGKELEPDMRGNQFEEDEDVRFDCEQEPMKSNKEQTRDAMMYKRQHGSIGGV